MLKRLAITTLAAGAIAIAGATAASATPIPSRPQDCGTLPSAPPGFSTDGFGNAESHYAGNGFGSLHAGSDHAVSQYDVACFQLSSH